MPEAVDLALLLRLEPAQVIEYLERRGYQISFNWFDIDALSHARSFTVAKGLTLDVLREVRGAVREAIQDGITERDFIRRLTPKLQALGWWGKREITGPDGQAIDVQLGSPARLKTIYRTNLRTAQSAGRYFQQLELAEDRPYWQYITIQDERVRASHAVMHGKVFRYDDPIWRWLYPPNGFGCRCRVRTLSEARLRAEGLTVESSAGRLGMRTVEVGIDRLTGEVIYQDIPTFDGLDMFGRPFKFNSDPGWDHNPGAVLFDTQGRTPPAGQQGNFARSVIPIVSGQNDWRSLGLQSVQRLSDREFLALPTTGGIQSGLDAVATALGMSMPGIVIRSPIEQVGITRQDLTHIATDNNQVAAAPMLRQLITKPWEIWLTEYADGFRRHYLQPVRDDRGRGLSVIRFNQDGSLYWWIARGRSMDAIRVGDLLWSEL